MNITEQEKTYLIRSMKNLLDEYDYEWDTDALDTIIEHWANAKSDLIQAFKNHPNYLDGQFMIAFDTDYERVVDKKASRRFSSYLTTSCFRVGFDDYLPEEIKEQRIAEDTAFLPSEIYTFLDNLVTIASRTISEETAQKINEIMPNVHAHSGEKTSRVINKVCTYLGYSKFSDYNKEFAKYADSLSPLHITRHTILSLNPLDYLTMSFGNSWASCHTIDKRNKRCMPNSYEGQYSSGTMSYMLDSVSMVFYTVDASFNGQEYWNEPKINRQMFHYGEEKLIQGRLYPQSNDYDSEEYTPNRNIVQKIIADIYDFPNLWTVKKGIEAASEYVDTEGTHYPDYKHFNNCSISRIKGSENDDEIVIGAAPICIECGCEHEIEECINCCTMPNRTFCTHCGCVIEHEDDECWVNGEVYCRDCVSYCDCCEEYHIGEEYYIEREGIYVCEDCLDENYRYCENCEEYVYRDDAYWCESEDGYICEHCYENDYATCSECGEIFRLDDITEHNGEYLCPNCYEEVAENEEEAC